MTVSEQLKQAIADCGETHYRIGKETGLRPHVISRFASGERNLNTPTVDTLCDYLGLELCRKTGRKQAGKKRGDASRKK